MWTALAGAVFGVAVAFSMLGQGGGTLYTPLQVWLGVPFHRAATTSLFLIMVTSLSASIVYRRAHEIDLPMALTLEAATWPGGLVGGLISDWFSGSALSLVFAAVVAAGAVFMIRPPASHRLRPDAPNSFLNWRRHVHGHAYSINLALALPVSFLAGVVSGMAGVGGGLIKVPLMALALGVPIDVAVGSSALMVGVTASGGFAGHVMRGHWDWRASLLLAAAAFIGAQVGSRITLRLDKDRLERGFGWFALTVAAAMAYKGLR
jgi:uncharacterized membrane protein YfcA